MSWQEVQNIVVILSWKATSKNVVDRTDIKKNPSDLEENVWVTFAWLLNTKPLTCG